MSGPSRDERAFVPSPSREDARREEAWLTAEADAFLVLGGLGWRLIDPFGSLAFSPGLAMLRVKRLLAGLQQPDQLLVQGEVRPGDVVVDATVGLGADLLVAAHAVGPRGRCLGIEASLPLYALVSEGVLRGGLPGHPGPIEVRHGLAAEVLAALPAGSADCVFLDPMFERPKGATQAFELLRRYACYAPLDEETLAQARRVARRWVVVKGGRWGKELRRLGLKPEPASRSSQTVFARLRGGG